MDMVTMVTIMVSTKTKNTSIVMVATTVQMGIGIMTEGQAEKVKAIMMVVVPENEEDN